MNNYLHSQRLLSFSGIYHGFSTKATKYDSRLFTLKQIHSDRVLYADQRTDQTGDGIVTKTLKLPIAVKTADCIPILLYEYKKRIVSVVHAGWKGTATSILQVAIRQIVQQGGLARDIIVSLGPSIGPCCYDVPRERAQSFKSRHSTYQNGKYFLNLHKANIEQARALGVLSNNIESIPLCTSCNTQLFYSYRKQNGAGIGSNISFIELIG